MILISYIVKCMIYIISFRGEIACFFFILLQKAFIYFPSASSSASDEDVLRLLRRLSLLTPPGTRLREKGFVSSVFKAVLN